MTRKLFTLFIVALLLLLSAAGALAQDQVLRIATGSVRRGQFQLPDSVRRRRISRTGSPSSRCRRFTLTSISTCRPATSTTGAPTTTARYRTFSVDSAARWSDGTSITAQQVIDSWQVQAAPLNSVGRIRTYLGNVAGFADAREMAAEEAMTVDVSGLSALDDSTVQVELVLPDPIFFWRIATAHMAIARAEDVLEHGFNEFWKPERQPDRQRSLSSSPASTPICRRPR